MANQNVADFITRHHKMQLFNAEISAEKQSINRNSI